MAFTSEPWDQTLARRQQNVVAYPELQYSSPTEIAQIDAAFPHRLPTSFTQQAVRLANFGSAPDDPNAPDAAPNALPWTTSGPLSGAPQSSGDEYQQGKDALAFLRGGGQAAPEQPAYGGNGIGGALADLGGEIGSLPGAIGSLLGDEWNKSQEQARARAAQLQNLPVSGDALPTPSVGDWLGSAAGLNDPLKSTPLIQTRGAELATLTNPANLVGLVAPELSFAPESGPILRVLTDVVANTAGGWGSEEAKQAAKRAGLPQWAQELAGTAGGIAAGGIAGSATGIVGRNAKSWMEAADSAIADVQAAQRAASPEAFQTGNIPGTDSLFTAGPNGEVVGPTGNVTELRLGREPQVGEDVNAGLRYTNYGRAQQANLAAEEQAAFRDAGDRAISGANPADVAPPLGGGSGTSDAEFARLTQQADAEKAATGSVSAATHDALMNLLGERIGATPTAEQAAAREAFYRDPANLGGGQTLSPEQQANLDALAPHAQQLNTITDSLANARAGDAAPADPFARFDTPNPDALPEPTRTQPPPGYLDRFRQPPAGGADLPGSQPPIVPRGGSQAPRPSRATAQEVTSGDVSGGLARDAATQAREAARLQGIADAAQAARDAELARGARYTGNPGIPTSSVTSQVADRQATAQAVRAAAEKAAASITEKPSLLNQITDVANLPRTILTSFDLSAPFRQGAMLIGHPREFFGNLKPMLEAFASKDTAQTIDDAIRSGARGTIKEQAGLYLSPLDETAPLTNREEAYMSRLAGKIPGVAGSQRAYATFLNKTRSDVFDHFWEGLPFEAQTAENAARYAHFINAATGRGSLPNAVKDLAPALNAAFFSPRYFISRFESNGMGIKALADVAKGVATRETLDPVSKQIAGDVLKFYGTGAAALGLAKASGASVEFDPRSSDFGKIKVGDTRYDLWAGNQQIARFIAQEATGQKNSGGTTTAYPRNSTALNFLRSKLGPVPGLAWDMLKGTTPTGDKVDTTPANLRTILFNEFVPMIAQDIIDGAKDAGVVGAARALPTIVGVGTQTYAPTTATGRGTRPTRPVSVRPTRPTR